MPGTKGQGAGRQAEQVENMVATLISDELEQLATFFAVLRRY
jgi:hypothetical protein